MYSKVHVKAKVCNQENIDKLKKQSCKCYIVNLTVILIQVQAITIRYFRDICKLLSVNTPPPPKKKNQQQKIQRTLINVNTKNKNR